MHLEKFDVVSHLEDGPCPQDFTSTFVTVHIDSHEFSLCHLPTLTFPSMLITVSFYPLDFAFSWNLTYSLNTCIVLIRLVTYLILCREQNMETNKVDEECLIITNIKVIRPT